MAANSTPIDEIKDLNDIIDTIEEIKKMDLEGTGFNYYTYVTDVTSRGNQPYSISDISKIESKQRMTCKSCAYFRGEFGDKYLCKRPSSSVNLNNCFVSKKELDDLDFCVDYKYDYNRAKKSSSKKTFCFNQPFKDIWE
jgi:hypothetical protein